MKYGKGIWVVFLFCINTWFAAAQHQLPGVAIHVGRSMPFYFFKNEQEGTLHSKGPLMNSSYEIELMPRLSTRIQGTIGLQFLGRNFSVLYTPSLPGQKREMRHTSSIFSTHVGIMHLIYTKGISTCFYFSGKLLYSKLNDDIQWLYNDTTPPSNYTLRGRYEHYPTHMLSAAVGLVIERDIYRNIFSLRLHPELVMNLFTGQSPRSNATNRAVLSLGLCYKVE